MAPREAFMRPLVVPIFVLMRWSVWRVAWIAFFASFGGAAVSGIVQITLSPPQPWLAFTWLLGAVVCSAWVWGDDVRSDEFRFTEDGAKVLGWFFALFLPPLGLLIGWRLARRGNRHGRPIFVVSLAFLALYLTAVMVDLL
jgi:hypothetical protein